MSRQGLRILVALVLLPWRLIPVPIGQEHRHVADDDHSRSAIHRHLYAHDVHDADHHHTRLAVDDAHVQWMDDGTLNASEFRLAVPAATAVDIFVFVPVSAPGSWVLEYWAVPAHGPPRSPSTLRGPPHLSA